MLPLPFLPSFFIPNLEGTDESTSLSLEMAFMRES